MSEPLRIAHVITKFAVGGAQESVLVTCEGLDTDRYQQVVFTGLEEDLEGTLFADAERRGVPIRLVPELRRPIRPLRDMQAVQALAERLGSFGADLVHTHSSKAGFLGRLAAHRLGVPVIHTVHGWSFNDEMSFAGRNAIVAVERWAARRTDALVVVATPDREKGLRAGIGRPDQYRLIRNGVDLAGLVYDPEGGRRFRADLGIDPGATVVGTVGRLADQKAPLAMVDMVRFLVDSGLDVHFVWVGDGPLRPLVEAATGAQDLEGRFHLAGVRRDIAAVLSGFDVFALSSLWEGLPITLTEAMAIGIPVAATAVDGCAEIIVDGECGLLVPPARPEALAAAVRRLIEDPSLARTCADAAGHRVQAWDRSVMLAQLAELYDEIVATGRPRSP